jgi:hypothetical protein
MCVVNHHPSKNVLMLSVRPFYIYWMIQKSPYIYIGISFSMMGAA